MNTTVPYLVSFPGGPLRPTRHGKYYSFMSDEDLTEFTVTAVTSGAASIADNVPGGGMLLSGAGTTDDSGANLQLDCSPIRLVSGESFRMMGPVSLGDAVESDFWFGLAPVDTSIVAGVTDFVGWRKVDGSAAMQPYYVRDSGTAQTLPAFTMVSGQQYVLSFESFVDSSNNGRTVFFVDGKSCGEIVHTTSHLAENFNLPSIPFQSGTAVGTIVATVHKLGFDTGDAGV